MRRLTLAALALAAACTHSTPPPVIELKHIGTPGGVSFDDACTPTGPEICDNAIDDNCNGVIDEGCGLAVGKVQFEAAWTDSAVVELDVSDPQGDKIDGVHRSTPSGLRLDRKCPEDGCHGHNVDNVVFTGQTPLPGQYSVTVRLVSVGKASLPVKVHFGWRVGDRLSGANFSLGARDEAKLFSFEM